MSSACASFDAIGTTAVVKVTNGSAIARDGSAVARDGSAVARAQELLEREVDALDRACSRFRDDSDLMRANRAGGRWTVVDPMLVEALEAAMRAAALTGGVVSPALGTALCVAGYDRDFAELPAGDAGDRRPCAPRIAVLDRGWRAIDIDATHRRIKVPAGMQLDLGATAKAWLADRSANAIFDELGGGVLVSLGGDIALAGTAPAGGWRVHVTDDHRHGADAPGQTIALAGGGLATSSTVTRRWRMDGAEMHHIIDASTGRSARSPWRTVSVAARTCLDANIATTATLAQASDASQWLRDQGLPARLVAHDGSVLTLGDWPQPALGAQVGACA
jgi:thiamine biosynthesis lipoprotein